MRLLKCLAVLLPLIGGTTAHSQGHLCSANETVLFKCTLRGKTLSLCASRPLNPTDGYVQYRFGTRSKLELEYPSRKIHPSDQFLVRDWRGAGTDRELMLSFKNKDFVYTLHHTHVSVRPRMNESDSLEGFGSSAELSVSRRGKVVMTQECVDATPLDWPSFLPARPLER